MSWELLADFKAQTGITLDDALIQRYLDEAVQEMKQYIFIPRRYQTGQQRTQHILTQRNLPETSNLIEGQTSPNFLFIADVNADRVIDTDDLNVFELDRITFVETDRKADITTFNSKYGVIDFGLTLPISSDKILVIEYREAKNFLPDILLQLKELNQLLAVNYLFQKVPFAKLQSGISSWTINSVTVGFDNVTINAIIDSNRKRIKELYNLLIPTYTIFNTLQASAPTARSFLRSVGFQRTS